MFQRASPPRGARLSSGRLKRGGHSSFAGAKVRLFPELAKHPAVFFALFAKYLHHTLYIIYTRARGGEGRGAMASLHTGQDRKGGERWHRSIRDRTGGEESYGIAPYGTGQEGREAMASLHTGRRGGEEGAR